MNQVNNLIGRKDDDYETGNEDMKTQAILEKKEDPNYAFRFDLITIPFLGKKIKYARTRK